MIRKKHHDKITRPVTAADAQCRKAANIADSLPGLRKQYDDLTSQFHGFSSPSTAATLTSPNDPSLAADFADATSTKPSGSESRRGPGPKTVRFSDADDVEAQRSRDDDAAARGLFGGRYRDNPDDTAGYRDRIDGEDMSNQQIHAYHQQIMEDQDAQLDALGASIGRQRELSMRIGDELDDQVMMLDENEHLVDRHQSRLDRARGQLGRIARAGSENKQMVAIVVLIIILVLLIIITK
jgi:syntaxin 8